MTSPLAFVTSHKSKSPLQKRTKSVTTMDFFFISSVFTLKNKHMHLQHMETSALPIPHIIHRGLCPHSDLSLRSLQKRLTSLCIVQLHLTFALVPCFEKKKCFNGNDFQKNTEAIMKNLL